MDFVIPDTRARPADRGAESYVKCTDALLARVVPTLEFELAANGDKLLPLHQLEAIYAGRLKPDGAAVKQKHFGRVSIDPRKFEEVEKELRALASQRSFDVSPCSISAYISRVATAHLSDAATLLRSDQLVPNQAPTGRGSSTFDFIWAESISVGSLCSADGTLGPWAALANLVGQRNAWSDRSLDGQNRLSAVIKALDTTVRRIEDLPRPKAPAPADGDGGGAAAAGHFLPSCDDDDEVLDGIGHYLDTTAMPAALFALIADRRDARLELRLRASYATSPSGVIRERFASFVTCFTHLHKIVDGLQIAEMLSNCELMASRLSSPPLTSVASYYALERIVSTLTYALDSDGGAAVSSPYDRVLRIITLGEQAAARASASARPASAGAAASDDTGGGDRDNKGTGAKCFESMHSDALRDFVAANANELNARLTTPESGMVDSPIDSGDAVRVLRIVFGFRKVAFWQFLLRPKSASTIDIFKTIDPFRDELGLYLSKRLVQKPDGRVAECDQGFKLDAGFLKNVRLLNWSGLDFYGGLRGAVEAHREDSDTYVHARWPDEVFSSADRVRLLKEDGDQLFHSLGFKRKDPNGWWGKMARIQDFLDNECPRGCEPEDELYRAFKEIISDAERMAQRAMESGPTAPFPDFGNAKGSWDGIIHELTNAATSERGRRKLKAKARSVDTRRARRSPSPAAHYDSDDDATVVAVSAAPPAAPPAAAPKATRVLKDGTGKLGGHVFKCNAAVLQMSFVKKDGTISQKYEWKVPDIKKVLQDTEGTDAKCFACAVYRLSNRYEYCPVAGTPGHEHMNSKCHTFKGEPWKILATKKYATPI